MFAITDTMTTLKEILHPSNGKHSVKEAVISLFFDKPIESPEKFESLLRQGLSGFFETFNAENEVQFQFTNQVNELVQSQPQLKKDVGFRFSSFKEGKLATVLQARNEVGRHYMSYHTLIYDDWDVFFPDFLEIVKVISVFQPEVCVQAFSLHYIDEFDWAKDIEIELNRIFREDSDYLPPSFFKARLINYNLTTLNNEPEYFDRLDITRTDAAQQVLTISHNLTRKLETTTPLPSLLKSDQIEVVLNDAHLKNKNLLIDILTQEVCDLIKLKP